MAGRGYSRARSTLWRGAMETLRNEAGGRGSPDDVVVVHLFEQADLADRGTRHALILCLESDLFQRDNLVRLLVPGAVLFPRGGVVSASVRLRARVAKRGGDRELTTTPYVPVFRREARAGCSTGGTRERERESCQPTLPRSDTPLPLPRATACPARPRPCLKCLEV